MQTQHARKSNRVSTRKCLFELLLLEEDLEFATELKELIESDILTQVTIASSLEQAAEILQANTHRFFMGITTVVNLDSDAFEKIDLLARFNLPVIAIVNDYEDELRDQLIKRHVIDYVVKGAKLDEAYICELIWRIYKNSKIKVMVADDSMVSRFVIARELALQKFTVIQTSNGVEALRILEEQPDIKLVLVDQQMPKMDGTSFVAKARELYPKDQLLIIGLSTSSEPRLSVKFLKAGANDFITKPFNYETLLCRINQNLDMLDAVDLAKELSNIDFLSGLYNRRFFFEQGNRLLRGLEAEQSLTVMMMDIDFFKKINDNYGHDVGDEVIKHVASLIKAHFSEDIVARIGGEEFAVISTLPEYRTNADRIEAFRHEVATQVIKSKQHALRCTCSIGVCNEPKASLDEMLAVADNNLYMAKRAGRNQVYGNFSLSESVE